MPDDLYLRLLNRVYSLVVSCYVMAYDYSNKLWFCCRVDTNGIPRIRSILLTAITLLWVVWKMPRDKADRADLGKYGLGAVG
ncbi:hypothetical protein N7524_005710 [Penicillium chrysogenum]|nr:hypothetical protein N7524_005710 [Penicillium chrysogenum]